MPRSFSSSTTNMPSSSPSSMPSSSLYRSAVHVGKSERSLENEEDHVQDDDLYTSNGGGGGGRAAATNPFLSNLYPYQQQTQAQTQAKRIERASFSQVESVIGHHHTHVTTTTTRSTGLQKNNSNSSILEMEDEEEEEDNNDEKNQFIRGTHFEITNGGGTTTTTTNGHSHTHRPFPNATAAATVAHSKSIATINLHDINDSDDDDSNDDDDGVYIPTSPSPLLNSILAKVVPTPPSPLLTFLLILYALAITASWAYLLFRSIETPPFHTIQADAELIQDYKETIQELKEEVGRLKIVNERMEEGMEMVLGDKDVLQDKVVELQNKTNWLELQCNNITHVK